MRQRAIFLLLLQFSFCICFSQLNRSNFWPFITKAIDFSSGSPVITTSQFSIQEANSSISDTAGNLLFYTDGEIVNNAEKTQMPNGTGLNGCYSSSRGALIVPMPRNPYLYYIFAASCSEDGYVEGGTYSIVDMRLDSGRGDVTVKNQTIRLNVAEEIAATYHANNCDFWIIYHDLYSNSYYSYLLTGAGLDTVPVVSNVGPDYNLVIAGSRGRSMLVFNRNGTMAAQTARNYTSPQVHHFDRSTGQLSFYLNIFPGIYTDFYASCFSPNDSVLYVTASIFNGSTTDSYLLQHDLSTPTSTAVSASRQVLLVQNTYNLFGQMQLGPDGKIYFVSRPNSLGIIHNPNVMGAGANADTAGLYVGYWAIRMGLPNFVSQFIGPGPNLVCPPPVAVELADEENTVHVFPNPTNGPINFEFKQILGENYRLQITDLMGRIVFSDERVEGPFQVQMENLAVGVYVYALFEGQKLISKGKLRLD